MIVFNISKLEINIFTIPREVLLSTKKIHLCSRIHVLQDKVITVIKDRLKLELSLELSRYLPNKPYGIRCKRDLEISVSVSRSTFGKHLLLVRICTKIPRTEFVTYISCYFIFFFWRIQGWLPLALALFEPSNRIHVHGMPWIGWLGWLDMHGYV